MANSSEQLRASSEQLCALLGISRPVLLAPMAKIAGGRLAAAVSNAGGFGIIGGGYGNPEWIADEVAAAQGSRVGIGLITWNMAEDAVETALSHKPAAVWLSFGQPAPHLSMIKDAGVIAICQVGTVDEAVAAVDAGADIVVAQGSEAGGHGRPGRALFGLLPAISDAIGPVPLLAAGGISDRRGFDAAVALGASGVALGTAFYATDEAADVPAAKERLVNSRGDDTIHSTVYDLVRGPEWPAEYTGRSIKTSLTDTWAGREDELRDVVEPIAVQHAQAAESADMSIRVVWAGEGLDGIDAIRPAADVLDQFPTAYVDLGSAPPPTSAVGSDDESMIQASRGRD